MVDNQHYLYQFTIYISCNKNPLLWKEGRGFIAVGFSQNQTSILRIYLLMLCTDYTIISAQYFSVSQITAISAQFVSAVNSAKITGKTYE
jgi:hypothetical protein